jgi:hypothetical protein
MYTYPRRWANCRARVLFPQDDHPSMVTMMGLDVALGMGWP